jgi:type VI protein secretion system component VasK
MEESIQISAMTVTLIGAVLALLLGAISWLLVRLISSFDGNFKLLTEQVAKLNDTMIKIDKDSVAMQVENTHIQEKVEGIEPLRERVSIVEHDLDHLRRTGCNIYAAVCKAQHAGQ